MTLENIDGFYYFYISGNRNECPLQISCLIINFICDVNTTSLNFQQDSGQCSCPSHTLHNWSATTHYSRFFHSARHVPPNSQAGDVLRVHYVSMKCGVSFSQGSVSTILRWGGHFHTRVKISSCLQQCKNYINRSRFSKVIITNVLPRFLWFTVYHKIH